MEDAHLKKLWRIAYLATRQFLTLSTAAEDQELADWVGNNPARKRSLIHLRQRVQIEDAQEELRTERAWNRMLTRTQVVPATVIPQRRSNIRPLWTFISAAAIVLALGVVGYVYINKTPEPIQIVFDDSHLEKEVRLFSSTGQEIALDTSEAGIVQREGQLYYADGRALEIWQEGDVLKDSGHDRNGAKVQQLRLVTSAQRMYSIDLADGSRVWLNAQTTLTYPQHFDSNERRVQLEGEAFFDIAKSDKPFLVQVGDLTVNVHGTQFNVRAYTDQQRIETALIEGSVSIQEQANSQKSVLVPGQLAVYDKRERNAKIDLFTPNVMDAHQWTSGKLYFRSTPLEEVLARLSTWYGFEFVFEQKDIAKKLLTGVAYTGHDLDHILKLVTESTASSYYWKDNQLYITNTRNK